MKTKQQSKFILRLLAVALFLTASHVASGQASEYIIGSNSSLCDTTIIRSIGKDSVLIYNKRASSEFVLQTQSALPYLPSWHIEPIFINDFEVVGKRVYFCGYRDYGNTRKAVFGSFSLSAMYGNSLSYYELDTCTELKKIEYYLYEEYQGPGMNYNEYHIAMTGTRGTRSDVIVDVIMGASVMAPPLMFNCWVYFSENDDESFDDVAVTDNHVVVSTRNKTQGFSTIDFWQFDKPAAIWSTFLATNINHLSLTSPASDTPVFLEHVESDMYAATYKVKGFHQMSMLQLTAPYTLNDCVLIHGDDNNTVIPIDIKYNKAGYVFDILARNSHFRDDPESGSVDMQIYHVTPAVLAGLTTFGDGTRYPDHLLWSIDPAKSSHYFVASGDRNILSRVFRYTYNQWKTCPERFEYGFDLGKPEYNLNENKVSSKMYILEPLTITVDPRETNYHFICPKENTTNQ